MSSKMEPFVGMSFVIGKHNDALIHAYMCHRTRIGRWNNDI